MSPRPTGKPRLNNEDRRTSIVDTACKLFAERGFRGTTTREIAAAVGVTEPVIYEHFKTKRDLYTAIIASKAQAGLAQVEALATKYAAVEDDRGFFTELGEQIVAKDPMFIRLLLYSSLEGHELRDLFYEQNYNCFDIIARYIERRIESGAMRPVNPYVAARAFFGTVAHYMLSGVVFKFAPFSQPPSEVVREMVDLFLGGVCGQGKL